MIQRALAILFTLSVAACGQTAPAPAPASTPAPAPAASTPVAAPTPAGTVTLIEPIDGAIAGHIDLFRWSATDGADGYVLKILGSDGRTVYESPAAPAIEVHLPKTVALEPEAHTWSVTARKSGAVIATSPTFKFQITP